MEKLSGRNPCKTCQKNCCPYYECEEHANYEYNCMKKLEEYENAEEDGRLVLMPCKIGIFVYVLRESWNGWNIDKKKFKYGMIDKVGKTVFLTKEEAEKALEEMRF